VTHNPTLSLGAQMQREMAEQPRNLSELTARFDATAAQVAHLARHDVAGVAFLARGSSDNAALLGRYVTEIESGRPTSLLAPSVSTAFGRSLEHFAGWVVVALSQSGQTPEIVRLAEEAKRAGARVVALTNDASSGLAEVSDLTVDVRSGPELAVPATKSVTSQMLAVLAVAAGVAGDAGTGLSGATLTTLPEQVQSLLADHEPVAKAAAELTGSGRVAVVGRGTCYPAALETALKLQETSGVMAHGFSTADFRHGPIAVCGPETPAALLAGSGPADHDTRDVREALRARGAQSVLIGTSTGQVAPDIPFPAAATAAECILATVRGQQLALHLCQELGIDPDQPPGLNKVTLTH
jgi:glucosamine--fructose-6-phosphate aminotransferase (isomerizing)